MESGLPVDDFFEAAKEAGRQLVENGKTSPETLNVVSRELLPLRMYGRGQIGDNPFASLLGV